MTARPLLVAGTLALGAAAVVAPFPVDARVVAGLVALWVALTAGGLLSFYVPAFLRTRRGATPHAASDRAVAFGVVFAGVALAAGLALGAFRDPRAVAFLLVAPVLPLVAAGALHVLPRQAKRPVGLVPACFLVAAAALAGTATPYAALALGLPALLAAGAGLAVLVLRARSAPGVQARASRPLFAAAAAALLAVPPLALLRAEAAAVALLLGEGLLLAALTYALAPVVVNQVPRDRRWTSGLAVGALAGGALLAWGLAGGPTALAGRVVLALVALAHVANLAPMRRPRRECPPDVGE